MKLLVVTSLLFLTNFIHNTWYREFQYAWLFLLLSVTSIFIHSGIFLDIFTFQTPIIYYNSALRQNYMIYKGDLSVKSYSYLTTFKNADPKGSTFRMSKGLEESLDIHNKIVILDKIILLLIFTYGLYIYWKTGVSIFPIVSLLSVAFIYLGIYGQEEGTEFSHTLMHIIGCLGNHSLIYDFGYSLYIQQKISKYRYIINIDNTIRSLLT